MRGLLVRPRQVAGLWAAYRPSTGWGLEVLVPAAAERGLLVTVAGHTDFPAWLASAPERVLAALAGPGSSGVLTVDAAGGYLALDWHPVHSPESATGGDPGVLNGPHAVVTTTANRVSRPPRNAATGPEWEGPTATARVVIGG
ncbi:hypothetical protein Nans01_27210 [Nocardiopsis ansamitocini]|uniref:Uncharacterized protein n=1 Tax=Nocardiopsis ansamitocini TaxID=1670832 RepID=A0A9W6P6J3_9ACTN|nr:hypothetical protein Nans01_27210 [Nocardiopsis ansamitocini]